MGKMKVFSAILIMAAVFTVANAQCWPGRGQWVPMNKGDSVGEIATCVGIECSSLVKYLVVYQRATIKNGLLELPASVMLAPAERIKVICDSLDTANQPPNVSLSKPKAKAKKPKGKYTNKPHASELELASGPMLWKYPGGDPLRCTFAEAFDSLSCSTWPQVKAVMQEKRDVDDTVAGRFALRVGDTVNEMVGGLHYVYGKDRKVVGAWRDRNKVLYGTLYEINLTDSILQVIIFDTCGNVAWKVRYPSLPPAVSVTPTPTIPIVPPPANPPRTRTWVDSTPPQPVQPPPPTVKNDSLPPMPTNVPSPTRNPYGDDFFWLGHSIPLPLWYGGNNYLGGMVSGYLPVGKRSGFGLSLKANGYQGWGPLPVPDTIRSDIYAGFQAGIGPILDLRSARTRTTIALRYYFQGDWYWVNQAGAPRDQLTHLVAPELTFYAANQNWSRWLEGWAGLRQDLQYVFPDVSFSQKRPFSLDNPPVNKTVGEFGLRWFCIPLSQSNLWTLGFLVQGDYMNEDNRGELAAGLALRGGDWRLSIAPKSTFNSSYLWNNGWSINVGVDYDATPKSQAASNRKYIGE